MSFNEFELVETGDERDDTEPTVIEQTDEKPTIPIDEESKVASHAAAAVEIDEKSKPELEEQSKLELELEEQPKPSKSRNEPPSVATTPKEVSVKEHRKSRSKHHGDRSEKSSGSAPAVQFEITSRGVRVISEKESFL